MLKNIKLVFTQNTNKKCRLIKIDKSKCCDNFYGYCNVCLYLKRGRKIITYITFTFSEVVFTLEI